MDAETSAMVEALYASGKVERPAFHDRRLRYVKHAWNDGPEWDYYEPPGIAVVCSTPVAVIGWSLVQACWANGWWIRQDADGLGVFAPTLDTVDLSGPDEFMLLSHPSPIRAMVEALNGGG